MNISQRPPSMMISAFQMGTIIVGVMLSLGPLFIGRIATENAARDGWFVTMAASIIVFINTWMMMKLAARYPDLTVTQYAERLLGKWLGKLVGIVIIALGALSCGVTLWYTGRLFNTYILLMTPAYVLSLLLLLLTVYVSVCGLRTLGRVTVLIFFISLPFNLFFVSPVMNHGDIYHLLPLFENDAGTFVSGTLAVLFAYAGYEVLQTYYPYVIDQRKSMMHALWAVTFVSVLFILAVITQQLVYPLDYLAKIWAPSVQYVALVSMPILERTDMIFILFWFLVLFKTNTMYFYRAVLEIGHVTGIQRRNVIIVTLAVIVYSFSFISISIEEMERWFLYIFSTSVGISMILTPLLLVIDTWKRRRGSA